MTEVLKNMRRMTPGSGSTIEKEVGIQVQLQEELL
jgi:hypothetical protein